MAMSRCDRNAFFPNAQNFKIYGGTFINYTRDQDISSNMKNEIDDLLGIPIIRADEINLEREVICADGYRIHAAQFNGHAVAVKVFGGPRAQEARDASAASSSAVWHPNFLQLLGCSPHLFPNPFLIYHGGVEGAAELKMASVLCEGKSESMFVIGTMASLISCRTLSPDEGVPYQVHEIAFGLRYLASKDNLLECLKSEDFDLLIDPKGSLKISIRSESLPQEDIIMTAAAANPHLDLLDSLCHRAFSEANRIVYGAAVQMVTYERRDFRLAIKISSVADGGLRYRQEAVINARPTHNPFPYFLRSPPQLLTSLPSVRWRND
ncbi:hypothetical protein B0H13DRAFT_2653984 [Mycena leptocephala]|nr:hypothetical protein B0H13DRAFT_2653984 [Mycena leptocephala]